MSQDSIFNCILKEHASSPGENLTTIVHCTNNKEHFNGTWCFFTASFLFRELLWPAQWQIADPIQANWCFVHYLNPNDFCLHIMHVSIKVERCKTWKGSFIFKNCREWNRSHTGWNFPCSANLKGTGASSCWQHMGSNGLVLPSLCMTCISFSPNGDKCNYQVYVFTASCCRTHSWHMFFLTHP